MLDYDDRYEFPLDIICCVFFLLELVKIALLFVVCTYNVERINTSRVFILCSAVTID